MKISPSPCCASADAAKTARRRNLIILGFALLIIIVSVCARTIGV